MTFVDTNLLVRILTNDIPELHDRAIELLAAHDQDNLSVPDIVLTELFFVLEHDPAYRYTRQEVCETLGELLTKAPLGISEVARPALILAKAKPKLDFTDCLLAVYAGKQTTQLLTFDKDLLKTLH